MQPWGCIFQNGFLGEVQFKKSLERGLFDQKMGFYSRKNPKTGLLKRAEVIFKSGAILERIRYLIRTFIHFN